MSRFGVFVFFVFSVLVFDLKAFEVKSVLIELPVLRAVGGVSKTKEFPLVGAFYENNFPVINGTESYSKDNPYFLFERLLSVYKDGTVSELIDLYTKGTRSSAKDIFTEIGESAFLEHVREINEFKVYGYFLGNDGQLLFYMGINDSSEIMPYLVGFEDDGWKLISDSIDSEISMHLDNVIFSGRWGEIRITENAVLELDDLMKMVLSED